MEFQKYNIKEKKKEKKYRKRKKKKAKSQKLFLKKYRYKIDNKYQKAKIKNLEWSLEFQKYNVKKNEEEK